MAARSFPNPKVASATLRERQSKIQNGIRSFFPSRECKLFGVFRLKVEQTAAYRSTTELFINFSSMNLETASLDPFPFDVDG